MRATILMLCLFILTACGGSGAAEGGSEASSGGDMSQYEGPIASTDTARGEEVFLMFCDDCHPDGGADDGPSLLEHPTTAAMMRKQIREGSGKMRPFPVKRLSDDDLEAALAFMQQMGAVK